MHDCPTCRVPLHGYEEVCPSCGTKQYVKPELRRSNVPPPPGVNPLPFVVLFLIVAVIGVASLKSSWIGQVFTNPVKEDPIAKLTPLEARTVIENQIVTGLTAIGSKGTFKYTAGEKPTDKNAPGPVELTIDTSIKDGNQRKAIIDPIRDYFGPARIGTLTVNDTPRHRTWTYTAALQAAPEAPDTGIDTGTAAPAPESLPAQAPQQ